MVKIIVISINGMQLGFLHILSYRIGGKYTVKELNYTRFFIRNEARALAAKVS